MWQAADLNRGSPETQAARLAAETNSHKASPSKNPEPASPSPTVRLECGVSSDENWESSSRPKHGLLDTIGLWNSPPQDVVRALAEGSYANSGKTDRLSKGRQLVTATFVLCLSRVFACSLSIGCKATAAGIYYTVPSCAWGLWALSCRVFLMSPHTYLGIQDARQTLAFARPPFFNSAFETSQASWQVCFHEQLVGTRYFISSGTECGGGQNWLNARAPFQCISDVLCAAMLKKPLHSSLNFLTLNIEPAF